VQDPSFEKSIEINVGLPEEVKSLAAELSTIEDEKKALEIIQNKKPEVSFKTRPCTWNGRSAEVKNTKLQPYFTQEITCKPSEKKKMAKEQFATYFPRTRDYELKSDRCAEMYRTSQVPRKTGLQLRD
jgi:hypothetical protein